jgi:ABC-type nitrate/sulfonate/bicarbonate transport system substrate-binding protein
MSISGRNLPVVIGQKQGIFAKHGLEVQLEVAPNSDTLRSALASGKADVAHAAVDNDVAMVESGVADVVIVMGGEGSLNELIAQPEIHAISELRGKTLIVDAPHTAFALQLKKILLSSGLQAGRDYQLKPIGATPVRLQAMREHKDYAASMLGPPSSIEAKRDGFVSLGATQKFIGAYQGFGAFVRRQWAREHSDALIRYIAAYVEAVRWLLDPINKQQVVELLMQEFRLPAPIAKESYAASTTSQGGYQPDARFDVDGFKNVLKLRAEVEGQWGGRAPAADRYYDLSYYEQALAGLIAAEKSSTAK